MPRECPYCKRPLPAEELTIDHWICFLCGHYFPPSINSTVQEIDGTLRILCPNCLEDYQEYVHGIAYLEQRKLERQKLMIATKKGTENI